MNDPQVPENELTPEQVTALAEASADLARFAYENNAGALIMYPYDGPPPPASFFLDMMKEMIEETGDAMGSMCLSTGTESGTLPLTDIHPVDALHAVLHGRMVGVIPKIHWVTVAFDSYVIKGVGQQDVARGSASEAFKRGDADAYEALCAMCVAPDGPGYDVHQAYVRSDDGIEWHEPENVRASDGDIPSLMNQIVLA